jgi:hypothetical protein
LVHTIGVVVAEVAVTKAVILATAALVVVEVAHRVVAAQILIPAQTHGPMAQVPQH